MKRNILIGAVMASVLATHSYGAVTTVITSPAIVTGSNAIAPNNNVTITPSGATAQATLEGLVGFGAIQSFGFAGNANNTDQAVFDNTAAGLPDIQFSWTNSSGVIAISNAGFATSGSSSLRYQASTNTGSTTTLRVDLGTYSATPTMTFTNLATGGVSALGFTLTGRSNGVESTVIRYFDVAGGVLSTQTVLADPDPLNEGANNRIYTGFQSAGNPISYVTITMTDTTAAGSTPLYGLDDLGFTALVPEPSSALLGALGAMLLIGRRRR